MAKISVYDKDETIFINNGIVLSDVVGCEIEEELNGKYVLELVHPIDENGKWENLVEENIIKADGQLFRIHSTESNLDYVYVYARHIFYDLLHNFLEDVRPTNANGSSALNWILLNTQYPHNFVGMSNIATLNTQYYIRQNPVEAMLGEDSLVTRWGGELDRDNFTIKLLTSIGSDKGAQIAYGKNMLGLDVKRDMDTVITRIMPIGNDGLLLPELYIDSPLINNYAFPRIAKIELDIGINEDNTENQAFTLMRQACNDLYSLNKVDIPYININTNLLMLENTEEYKHIQNLIKVELGDIVSCTDNPLNVTFKSKVIRIKKDVLSNKNVEVELGQFKKGISDTLNNAIKDISEELQHSTSNLEKAIADATELLTNALGGYVVKRPGEILIMDTEDINTATQIWRWNLNGLGYSNAGVNGPYEVAMTMDGKINANFITTGKLNGAFIEAGTILAEQILVTNEATLGEYAAIVDDNISQLLLTNGEFNTRIQSIEANMNFQYMQDMPPDNPEVGDVWFSTWGNVFIVNNLLMLVDEMTETVLYYGNSLNKSYRWNGSAWKWIEDGAITELRQEVSEIDQTSEALSSKVISVETDAINLQSRVLNAEQKITDDAIVALVKSKAITGDDALAKKGEMELSDEALELRFENMKSLNGEDGVIEGGVFRFDKDKLRVMHSIDKTQYSDVRFDGIFRQYSEGEGAYLNDIHIEEIRISRDVIGNSNIPNSSRVWLPTRFIGRNVEALVTGVGFRMFPDFKVSPDGTRTAMPGSAPDPYGVDSVVEVINKNLSANPPYVDVLSYSAFPFYSGSGGWRMLYRESDFLLVVIGK